MTTDEIKKLSLPEKILIAEEIRDSIVKDAKLTELKHRAGRNSDHVRMNLIADADRLAALYGEFCPA